MKNLNDASIDELQKELVRRTKVHKFKIDEVDFELTLEQIKKLQKELVKINPPFNDWAKYYEKNRKDIPMVPFDKFPIPYSPNNPFPTYPPKEYPHDKIWCHSSSLN